MNDVDTHIETIRRRFPRWLMWNTADGRFVITVTDPSTGRDKQADHVLLSEAVAMAAQLQFLPVVPYPPLWASYEVVRQDDEPQARRWAVVGRGRDGGEVGKIPFSTKAGAVAGAERGRERNATTREEWAIQYGALVASGTEGVDYEWVGLRPVQWEDRAASEIPAA